MTRFNSRHIRLWALLVVLLLICVSHLASAPGKVQVNADALKMFAPLPAAVNSLDNPATNAKVKLGRMLYYDPRLSANQKISCNTCHPLDAYGADAKSVSTGFKHQQGKRNAIETWRSKSGYRRMANQCRAGQKPGGDPQLLERIGSLGRTRTCDLDGHAFECRGRRGDQVHAGLCCAIPGSISL